MTTEFNKVPKGKAFSFGVSRDFFKKVYLKENPPRDVSVPGPGHYRPNTTLTEQNGGLFSIRPKTANSSAFQNFTKFVPGPGTYNISRGTEN